MCICGFVKKVKVNFTLGETTAAQRRKRGITLLSL